MVAKRSNKKVAEESVKEVAIEPVVKAKTLKSKKTVADVSEIVEVNAVIKANAAKIAATQPASKDKSANKKAVKTAAEVVDVESEVKAEDVEVKSKTQKKDKKTVTVWAKDEDDKKDVKSQSLEKILSASDAEKLQTIKDQARVALVALRKYFADRGGKSLFPDIDQALHLSFIYKKSALNFADQQKAKIVLPHSHRTIANTTVCIIMPDLDQSVKGRTDPDVDKQSRKWAEQIEKDHGLTSKHYAKLITKRQLEREYHSYHDKRALATTYDMFMVDSRVGKAVSKFLGKEFQRAHKQPHWFVYSDPMVVSIEESLNTVTFPLHKYMTRVAVNIGHLGQDTADLTGNMDVVFDRVVDVCPGGLLNLRSIYLQPSSSQPSLPVYSDLGTSSEVKLATDRRKDHRDQQTIEDECSTLPDGLKLRVRRDGELMVVKEEDNEEILYPTIHDEWDENDINKPEINLAHVKSKRAANKRRREVKKANKMDKKPKLEKGI